MKTIKKISYLSALLLTFLLFSCGSRPIALGALLPLTGDSKTYGKGVKKGIEMAMRDANLKNIKFFYADSKCSGPEAINELKRLSKIEKVSALIGEICSSATLAVAPTAEEEKVVLITPSSTSPKVREASDYLFRTIPSDALQSDFTSKLLFSQGFRKLAILYPNEDYGAGFSTELEKKFVGLGGQVVANESFERGAGKIVTQLDKIKLAKPDVLFLISNSPDNAVVLISTIRKNDIEVALYGSEGLKAPIVAETPAAEGLIISSVSTGTEEFQAAHQEMFGEAPGSYAAQAYDAFMVLAEAIKKGAQTGPEFKETLYKINLDGVSGKINFDEYGDVSGNYDVYKLINREFVLQEVKLD